MHYTPDSRGDVLDIVEHQNILYSDHLQINFYILDPVRTKEASDPVEKLRGWKLFQSLASEIILSNIQIHSSNKAHKAPRYFADYIASAYRISTRKTTILNRIYEIPDLNRLLKPTRKIGKLG
jgi:hypothetical protein